MDDFSGSKELVSRQYVDQKVSSVTLTGAGSPEGKIAAPVGVTYTDTAATNGSIRWVKASGTGATGWRDDYGDTNSALATKADQSVITDATHQVGRADTLRANRLVKLDGNGKLYISYHSVVNDSDPVNKLYANMVLSKGVLADGTDINTLREPGNYVVSSEASAGTMINYPTTRAGIVKVSSGRTRDAGRETNVTIQEIVAYSGLGNRVEKYSRSTVSSNDTTWSTWFSDFPIGWIKGRANGTASEPRNIDTFRDEGAWAVTDASTVSGLPVNSHGVVENYIFAGTGLSLQKFTARISNSVTEVWQRWSLIVSGFTGIPWQKTSPTDTESGDGITDLHVFVCAGQSNMSGRGTPVDADLDVENPRLLQYGAHNRVLEPAPAILDMPDAPRGVSPARQFGLRYLADQPEHVGVLLIPAAYGGTAFTYEPQPGVRTWTKGHADTAENGLYELSVTQTQEAIAAATGAGYSVDVKGILWHQGEANASTDPADIAAYTTRLDELIADYRTDLSKPDLPFILGGLMPEGVRLSEGKQEIEHVITDTPKRVTRTAFATAPDNTMDYGDVHHFSREGALRLGDSMFGSWPRAVFNVPTGEPGAARDVSAYRAGSQVTVSWDAPLERVTSYLVEWADAPDGVWQAVTRDHPMGLSETFTAHNASTWVRVTAYEDTVAAAPSHPVPAHVV